MKSTGAGCVVKGIVGLSILLILAGSMSAQTAPDIVWQGQHNYVVRAVAFSPNGQQLASGSDDHTAKVWQVSNGALFQTLVQCSGGLTCGSASFVGFSQDGQQLAATGRGYKFWRISDATVLRTSNLVGVLSPDWQYVVSSIDNSVYGNTPSTVTVSRVSDGSQVWQASNAGGLDVAFSPDGQTVAVVGRKTGIDLWRISDGTHLLNIPGPKHALTFSADGQYIISTQAATGLYPHDDTIEVYRVSDGALIQTMRGTGAVGAMVTTPDSQVLISTGWESENNRYSILGQTGIIRFWRISDGALLKTYDQGTYTGAIAVSPDGNFFAYTRSDNSVILAHMPSLACPFSIDSATATFQHEGGIGTVQVTAPEGCNWTAYSRADWVHITGGASGTGNGTVTYSVDVGPCNQDSPTGYYTDGILVIAEQTYDVSQNECPIGPGHYSIWGQVTDGSPCYVGIAGVTVTLSGSATATTQTDSGGFFSFTNLTGQLSYTVTPSKNGYAFNPQSKTVAQLTYDSGMVFSATTNPYPRHTIMGYIRDRNGQPFAGVKINLAGGSYPQAVYSDSNGFYAFTCLDYGGNFSITPEYSGYAFTPTARAINNLSDDQASDFVGTVAPTAAPATISGQVKAADGRPLSGVVVSLSGAKSARTITDSLGQYRFDDVDTDNFYIVTPSRANYSFTPQNRSFSLMGNMTDALFTATPTVETANPLDTSYFFVRQHYLDFLGREPDAGGLEYWATGLDRCGTDADCIRQARISISAAYFMSQEFQATGSYVYRLYRAGLGRQLSYAEFSADRQHVVAGDNLDANKIALARAFVERPEFLMRYQSATSDSSFVDALLQTMREASGVDLSARRNALIAVYSTGANTDESRSLAIMSAVEDASFQQAEYNRAFVLMQYFGYLRRDADTGGYNFWLDVLNNRVPGNYRSMVCAFLTSAEYQRRFSSVVTHVNGECGQR
ncbi:MAG TPA: carboxypeptidase regulatory-like domain-containing protein [Pyrinomonadaceae bacterium]|nr:carboxypeptidase regulatory-like domain-containing protein [Pyrinomonadaceae bacterium]